MTAPVLPPMPERTLRNADITDIIEVLEHQQRQKVDVVFPARNIRMTDGQLGINCLEEVDVPEAITWRGVTPAMKVDPNGFYLPTAVADGHLAGLFKIPVQYVRRMRDENVGLLDTNINDWADKGRIWTGTKFDPDKRVLMRLLCGAQEGSDYAGVCRAVLSDRYDARDNLDTVFSMIEGMELAGLDVSNISQCNLSDDRLSVFVEAPEVAVHAPELLKGYRPSIEGQHGGTGYVEDIIHAGFYFGNSETGGGALRIVPRLVVRICTNGLQITREAFRKVHLGGKLDEGNIVWSDATREAAHTLVKNQVRDAVQAFLTEDFVAHQVEKLERDAGVELTKPEETIEQVAAKMSYTENQRNAILKRFIQGGQCTSGGIMQAVTLAAQEIDDPDAAIDFEATGVDAMRVAARHQKALA